LTLGITISSQIGLALKTLKKLQSFLVAADVACSRGDLPVVTVEVTLTAVTGLATAAEPAADPTLLAAATKGAAQDCKSRLLESANKTRAGRTKAL